eukprot:CAMPEP_0114262338 /NCGR_PEP_ID=MMETSP0058-20121206/21744_1 /TAXON_ID=36894 /ORGANISM="Pyramimonas parkeae, CCMP726" /LENGTH=69 /DNA_ID=CAMNT_0001378187 /DNA_START=234 /DNA_END=443 /DNA_ORIENTATION=-
MATNCSPLTIVATRAAHFARPPLSNPGPWPLSPARDSDDARLLVGISTTRARRPPKQIADAVSLARISP